MRVAILSLLILGGGCAHSVKELARESSRAAADESVEQLTDQEAQRKLADALADPRIAQAVDELTQNIVNGIVQGLQSDRTQAQVAKLARGAAQSAARAMIDALGGTHTQARLVQLSDALADSLAGKLSHAFQSDFAPALRHALRTDLGEGAASALTGPMHDALGATAQNVAYKAALGIDQGLETAWFGGDGAAHELRNAASSGFAWLKALCWALGLLALIALCIVALAITRAFRLHAEVRKLESASFLLATALSERNAGESDEIVRGVRDALAERADHRTRGILHVHRKHG
jgi:hypothetical protein